MGSALGLASVMDTLYKRESRHKRSRSESDGSQILRRIGETPNINLTGDNMGDKKSDIEIGFRNLAQDIDYRFETLEESKAWACHVDSLSERVDKLENVIEELDNTIDE